MLPYSVSIFDFTRYLCGADLLRKWSSYHDGCDKARRCSRCNWMMISHGYMLSKGNNLLTVRKMSRPQHIHNTTY